jgi:hypothetical protein
MRFSIDNIICWNIVNINNYNTFTNLHIRKIFTANTVFSIVTSRCLVVGSINATQDSKRRLRPPSHDCRLTDWLTDRATLWLAVYRQSIRLGAKPLETRDQRKTNSVILIRKRRFEDHDQRIYFQFNPCRHNPHVASSLTRGLVCLLLISLAKADVLVIYLETRTA